MRPAEETVVRQCAPTLAGIKTGSLFPCPYQSRQQRSQKTGTDFNKAVKNDPVKCTRTKGFSKH